MVENYRYQYFIDEEGNWFCDGRPVTDRDLTAFLSRCLVERDGDYVVACEGEVHLVTVADAPLVVRHIHRQLGAGGGLERVEIELGDGRRETLDGETLEISPQHILYCRATPQGLRARFCRPAYYELMGHLEMEGDFARFYVAIGGRRYVINPTREQAVERRDVKDA